MGDYRALNDKTEEDVYPLPHVKYYTHEIASCKAFSKVDLKKSFHQIVIDEKDRIKTCVTTPWGMFVFKRLSMGMSNTAQSFQRLVDSVVAGIPGVFAYLDDLIVFSKTHEEHLKVLEVLFGKLEKAGLTLALTKCIFGAAEIDYLRFKVNSAGLAPIPKKIDALQKFPPPTKQKELLAFLGALNYYRSSLPRLSPEESAGDQVSDRTPAAILDPLYKLVATCKLQKKKGEYEKIWSSSQVIQESFQDAKSLLQKAVT